MSTEDRKKFIVNEILSILENLASILERESFYSDDPEEEDRLRSAADSIERSRLEIISTHSK